MIFVRIRKRRSTNSSSMEAAWTPEMEPFQRLVNMTSLKKLYETEVVQRISE